MDNSENLLLKNQICFPLYTLSRLTTKLYAPLLDELLLTYPQYLVMLVLWDKNEVAVREITEALLLDTNTITPLLKRMEEKGLLQRNRSKSDERKVMVSLTEAGEALKSKAACIPEKIMSEFQTENIPNESGIEFRDNLTKMVEILKAKVWKDN